MTEPNPLPFTHEEYAARLVRVRERMDKARIEVLLTTVPENIVYLTGYSTLGYFTFQILLISLEQESCMLEPSSGQLRTGHSRSGWRTLVRLPAHSPGPNLRHRTPHDGAAAAR